MTKENIISRFFRMAGGVAAEIFLTVVLMAAAFLIGFIILRLFYKC
jgi:hypothetical protein